MNYFSTFQTIFKQIISPSDLLSILNNHQYTDTARKFTVSDLLSFFAEAALGRWKSFRHGSDIIGSINHSTISKKAADVPFGIFKSLFFLLLSRTNRQSRRSLKLPKALLSVDSTTITFGQNRLPWAAFHGKRSGIKLHVAFDNKLKIPLKAVESVGSTHDSMLLEGLVDKNYIVVADRAYFKIDRCDQFRQDSQSFVIRLKSNVEVYRKKNLKHLPENDSNITADYTCLVGTEQNRSKCRHRIVEFKDYEGKQIRVITDLMKVSAETVAKIYKERWAIEVFFKWLKQQMSLATIFGSSNNSVYNQLYSAVIAHVILRGIYVAMNRVQGGISLTFVQFTRKIFADTLPLNWQHFLSNAILYYLKFG